MGEDKRSAAMAGALGGAGFAATIAVINAALKNREVIASSDKIVGLDKAAMDVLLAIAQIADSADVNISTVAAGIGDLIQAVQSIQVNSGRGWPANTKSIIATRIQIQALNQWYQLPDIVVPDGFMLWVKGWPTNGGIILVSNSGSGATNVNQTWPLLPNEAVGYAIQNADALYISGTNAGDWAVLTVEQRR